MIRTEEDFGGILLIDKPAGLTSRRVVNLVSRALGIKKAGHLGTLDPFATGVLPVLVGRATRVAPYLELNPKEYLATLRLGQETDSQDSTGRVLREESELPKGPEVILDVFARFVGKIRQIAPGYSAVKHRGTPLYKLARRGQEVPLKERWVDIQQIEVVGISLPSVTFRVVCSAGTYIRALALDIGRELRCGAHLSALRRVRSGSFTLDNCISLEAFNGLVAAGKGREALISANHALGHLRSVCVPARAVSEIGQGRGLDLRDPSLKGALLLKPGERVRITSEEGKLLALAECRSGPESGEALVIHPVRVLI